jgi:hypothetical protein
LATTTWEGQIDAKDTAWLMEVGTSMEFPRTLGEHQFTQNGRTAGGWHGQYKGHAKGFTVILQAVASHSLWILHFSLAWQDLIMISMCCSDLRFSECLWLDVGVQLWDQRSLVHKGVLPCRWYLSYMVHTLWWQCPPLKMKNKLIAREHEAYKKDVEWAFSVLQSR